MKQIESEEINTEAGPEIVRRGCAQLTPIPVTREIERLDGAKLKLTTSEAKRLPFLLARIRSIRKKLHGTIYTNVVRSWKSDRHQRRLENPNAPIEPKENVLKRELERRRGLKRCLNETMEEAAPIITAIATRLQDAALRVLPKIRAEEESRCAKLGLSFEPSPFYKAVEMATWAPTVIAKYNAAVAPTEFLRRLNVRIPKVKKGKDEK
jgi:hypothetical protein